MQNLVYKLHKELDILKQSPRLWYKKLSTFLLKKLGFHQINANYNIFICLSSLNSLIMSMFVNDIKIMVLKETGFIEKVKEKLTTIFQIVNIRLISFYLGLRVNRNREKKIIELSQPVYIKKILQKFFFDQVNLVNMPIKKSLQLVPNDNR